MTKTAMVWILGATLCAAGCGRDGGVAAASRALTGDGPVPQQVSPIFNQTNHRDPSETYVTPSATIRLTPGHRLDLPSDFGLLTTPALVQRLTDRTYYIAVSVYQSMAHVGDQGVLLMDCPAPGGAASVDALLAAVASITSLPITHIVYSHPHSDHIGGCVSVKQRFPRAEIIASEGTADEIVRYALPAAVPTRVVKQRFGSFLFEGRRFRMVTPVPVAHTSGDSYVITPDRVLHAADIVSPGRLPFVNAMNNQNMDGYVLLLRHLAGERDNYDFAGHGHFNVGYAKDVDLTLDYLRTLHEAWWDTFQANPLFQYVDPTQDNAGVWVRNFWDGLSEDLFYAAVPDFGHVGLIELGRDHASKVHQSMFVYRFNSVLPGPAPLPRWDPIPPPAE